MVASIDQKYVKFVATKTRTFEQNGRVEIIQR